MKWDDWDASEDNSAQQIPSASPTNANAGAPTTGFAAQSGGLSRITSTAGLSPSNAFGDASADGKQPLFGRRRGTHCTTGLVCFHLFRRRGLHSEPLVFNVWSLACVAAGAPNASTEADNSTNTFMTRSPSANAPRAFGSDQPSQQAFSSVDAKKENAFSSGASDPNLAAGAPKAGRDRNRSLKERQQQEDEK